MTGDRVADHVLLHAMVLLLTLLVGILVGVIVSHHPRLGQPTASFARHREETARGAAWLLCWAVICLAVMLTWGWR